MASRLVRPAQHPWEVVRTIRIPSLSTATDAQEIRRALQEAPGVLELGLDLAKRRIQVRYDVNQMNYRVLLDLLEQGGHPTPSGFTRRIITALRDYADTNARDNAKAPPPPCCNKPPR